VILELESVRVCWGKLAFTEPSQLLKCNCIPKGNGFEFKKKLVMEFDN